MRFRPICRYCGQAQIPDDDFDNQTEADEWATLNCMCGDAQNYQEEVRRQQEREKNVKRIESALDEWAAFCREKELNVCNGFSEDMKEKIKAVAITVLDNDIKAAVLSFDGAKIKISMNSKGKVILAFTYSDGMINEV